MHFSRPKGMSKYIPQRKFQELSSQDPKLQTAGNDVDGAAVAWRTDTSCVIQDSSHKMVLLVGQRLVLSTATLSVH